MKIECLDGTNEMRVLLVDDNLMTVTLTSALLEQFGFKHIDTAANGQEAWDKIVSKKGTPDSYDLIFLDWNMPVMSGYDLLRRCREDISMSDLAIIMVTAENQKRNILEATKAGATSYITKPVNKDELLAKLSQIMDWKQKRALAR